MYRASLAMALAMAWGCAGPARLAPVHPAPAPAPAMACAPLTLTPDAALAPALADATRAWAEAGVGHLRAGAGGVPVRLVPFIEVPCPDGAVPTRPGPGGGWCDAWGLTVWDDRRARCEAIAMAETSPDWRRTLAHELGHCMGVRGHLDGGLMRAHGTGAVWDGVVDDAAVAAVEVSCGRE